MSFSDARSSTLLQERGQVVATRGATVLVRAASRIDCARCAAGEGCGGGVIGRLLGDRMEVVAARAEAGASPRPGDQVLLSVPGAVLIEAAATAYLLPLVVLLAALALASGWLAALPAWLQLGYAAGGLALGLAAARGLAHWRRHAAWMPLARLIDRPATDSGSAADRGPPCG